MLLIRAEQMAVFAESGSARFTAKITDHLGRVFPAWCANRGEAGVEQFVRDAVSKAMGYGIRMELDVARFLHLLIDLGDDFDTSPGTPWAARILNDSSLSAPVKIERLREWSEHEVAARTIAHGG